MYIDNRHTIFKFLAETATEMMKYLEEEIGNISKDRRPDYSINVDILIENRLMATPTCT